MLPLPWLIVGVLVSLFGTYRVGHHYGWLERDNDMKIAIAKKNDEAREIERNMGEKLGQRALIRRLDGPDMKFKTGMGGQRYAVADHDCMVQADRLGGCRLRCGCFCFGHRTAFQEAEKIVLPSQN